MKLDVVFEGGGAKGLAQVGAMEAFFANGHELGRTVGTSAGAMTAGLLAAGFSTAELKDAALERLPDGRPIFASFLDVPSKFPTDAIDESWLLAVLRAVDIPGVPAWLENLTDEKIIGLLLESENFREVFSFVERGGLYAGDRLHEWLRDKLNTKNGLGECNLAEFAERTGAELSVVGSDTTGEQMLVLNHRTAPHCPVAWAIRMSMGIPFVFQEVRWNSTWGRYSGENIDGHEIVDGGIVSNLALHLLVGESTEIEEVVGLSTADGVVGFLIDEDLPVPDAPSRSTDSKSKGHLLKRSRMIKRIDRLVNTMMSARDRFVMDGFEKHVCRLPAKGYGTTEFEMNEERIKALVNGGFQAAQGYFAKLGSS